MITRTCGTFYDTFDKILKGRVARLLDAEFEDFDMPKMAAGLRMKPTPSNIVLGTDDTIIKLSELAKYEAVLARAKEESGRMRALADSMMRINAGIWKYFMNTKILYRGMRMSEFLIISKMGGVVGLHPRTRYAAVNDFVSCSIDINAAAMFVTGKKESGMVVRMDASNMKKSDYAPVTYEPRRNIRVTRGGLRAYNPYEMFGGRHSAMHMREREIHLRNGSRPVISGVEVRGERPSSFRMHLDVAVRALESAQGRKIMIKYVKV